MRKKQTKLLVSWWKTFFCVSPNSPPPFPPPVNITHIQCKGIKNDDETTEKNCRNLVGALISRKMMNKNITQKCDKLLNSLFHPAKHLTFSIAALCMISDNHVFVVY